MIYLGFYTSAFNFVTLICVRVKGKCQSKPFEIYYFDADRNEPILYRCGSEFEAKFAFDFLLDASAEASIKECQIYKFGLDA